MAKQKISFFEILILVWTTIIPTIITIYLVNTYCEELDKITFKDNTLMKIALVVSLLHLIILLGIAISSIINDIKKMKKNKTKKRKIKRE